MASQSDAQRVERPLPTLSVVSRHGGWAIKHGNSFLGSTALLTDAVTVMAALARHTGDAVAPEVITR
jgi:hypothetical protein